MVVDPLYLSALRQQTEGVGWEEKKQEFVSLADRMERVMLHLRRSGRPPARRWASSARTCRPIVLVSVVGVLGRRRRRRSGSWLGS